MDNDARDYDKVTSSRLTGEDATFKFFSKDSYAVYKDTMDKYKHAEDLIKTNKHYVEYSGNPDAIDKDLFKKSFTVIDFKSKSTENHTEGNSQDKADIPSASVLKDLLKK